MKKYVAGFLFNEKGNQVALIEKQRPEWQKFKLNGIGGHIEDGEIPNDAMRREFKEETGVDLNSWNLYCILNGTGFEVNFYYAFSDLIYDIETKTDEEVRVYAVDNILGIGINYPLIPNLRWLIPMALSLIYEPGVTKYQVQEVAHV